ncbi:hypothetical protein ACNS7O_18295 (plasmid) [Haloferacaceae archaeon DSL9]
MIRGVDLRPLEPPLRIVEAMGIFIRSSYYVYTPLRRTEAVHPDDRRRCGRRIRGDRRGGEIGTMLSRTRIIGGCLLSFGIGITVFLLAVLFIASPTQQLVALTLIAGFFLLVGTLLAVLGVSWTAFRRARRASGAAFDAQQQRTQRWVEGHEARTPWLRSLALSEAVERFDRRDPEEKLADELVELQSRYVAGELDEREFEIRVAALLGERAGDADDEEPSTRIPEPSVSFSRR